MDVSIIGGGIAGLVHALTLHKHSVNCTVYELRHAEDVANPGAIALAPNALWPLEQLGMYDDIRDLGWMIDTIQFRNKMDDLVSSVDFGGGQRYSHDTLRIVRRRLHDVLLRTGQSVGLKIVSGKKFSHVISSGPSGVTFAFIDGSQVTTSILIGADGIHSTVRRTIEPDIKPKYQGSLTLAANILHNPLLTRPRTVELESRLHSISITEGKNSSFLAMVQSSDGQEITFGVDRPYPDQSRETWDTMLADKQKQYDLFMEDYDSWPEAVQTMMRAVTIKDMYRSWPYYAIPDLQQWSTSADRRVILVGDAAHAIPPSAGQGACMAVEDAWSLGLVLGSCQADGVDISSQAFQARIMKWQTQRKERVEKVRRLTQHMANARLPREMRQNMQGEFDLDDMSWLYSYEYRGQ